MSDAMWLIVGLGNPGERYASTRHNVGFMVIDRLAAEIGLPLNRNECQSQVAQAQLEGHPVLLAKPTTYMNRSGQAVACLTQRYDIPTSRVLVIMDDYSLPLGKLRLRARGGDGGHKGLQSILAAVDTLDVPRLRLGICPLEEQPDDLVDFVLSTFTVQESDLVESMVDRAQAVVRALLRDGLEKAMTKYN